MIRSALMNVMTAAALKAGRALKRDFGEVENLQVSVKGPGDFVTAADKKAEKTVFEELSKAQPRLRLHHGGIGRRSRAPTRATPGTSIRSTALPTSCTASRSSPSRSRSSARGSWWRAWSTIPANDDMFVAERGQGAYMNNRRLRVSARRNLADCIIGCGIPHLGKRRQHPRFLTEAQILMGQVSNLRRLGAAALDMCYVAAGRYDGYWERSIQSWDMAAGIVMIREAGGFVTDCDGNSRHDDEGRRLLRQRAGAFAALLGLLKDNEGAGLRQSMHGLLRERRRGAAAPEALLRADVGDARLDDGEQVGDRGEARALQRCG